MDNNKKAWICIIVFFIVAFTLITIIDKNKQRVEKISEEVKVKVKDFFNLTKDLNETEMEMELFKLTNQERIDKQRNPLMWYEELYQLSKAHSNSMIDNDFFEHSFKGNVGENIVQIPLHSQVEGCGTVYTNEEIVNCMFLSWKRSTTGHYENMIDKQYIQTSIGVVCNSYVCKGTQNFR